MVCVVLRGGFEPGFGYVCSSAGGELPGKLFSSDEEHMLPLPLVEQRFGGGMIALLTHDGSSCGCIAAGGVIACRMLAGNFSAMTGMGDEVLKPFLQDVIQFNPLMRTMAAQVVQDPGFVPQLMMHVVS
jgi:hypothetical protein